MFLLNPPIIFYFVLQCLILREMFTVKIEDESLVRYIGTNFSSDSNFKIIKPNLLYSQVETTGFRLLTKL